MRDRGLLLGLALLSLLLVWSVLVPGGQDARRASRPTSSDAGPAGQLAVRRWLEAAGIRTHSLRERFTRLDRVPDAPPTGNVLLMVMPHYDAATRAEIESLWEWVAAGNTVLLLAGFNDTPAWSYAGDGAGLDAGFTALTGLRLRADPAPPGDPAQLLPEPQRHVAIAQDDHWLMAGVGELVARSDLPASRWTLADEVDFENPYAIAFAAGDGRGAAWLLPDVDGQWVISAYASLFANQLVGEGGNRRFLANVVATYLDAGAVFIFDDRHQGVSLVYDARAFVGDPRFARSVGLLLLAWLAWVLFAGGGAPAPVASPGSAARPFVPLVGDFLAERLDPVAAGERLYADLWLDLAPRLGPPAPTPAMLARLAATGRVGAAQLRAAGAAADALAAGRRVDLVELHNLLHDIRRTVRA